VRIGGRASIKQEPLRSPFRRSIPGSGQWLKSHWSTLVGVILTLVLPAVVVRGVVFVPGWIEYSADFSVNINRTIELQQWSSGWNGFLGDVNSATLSFAPLFLIPLQALGTADTEKILLFTTYALMVGSSYFGLRSWLLDLGLGRVAYVASPLGAILYLLNPWVASESVHLLYLWLYALLPVTFHCVRRSVVAGQLSHAIGWAWLAGLSTVGTLTAYGIAFHGILSLIVVLVNARHSLARTVMIWFTYSASAVAGSAYWLLPVLIGFRQTFQTGTSSALFTTRDMYVLSPYSALPFAIRGIYRSWTTGLASQVVDDRLIAVALVAGVALPMSASWAALALGNRADAAVVALSILGAISLVMANGTEPPVGDVYARLASAPFVRQIAFVLFKGPYKWVPVALFVMLFLGTAALAALMSSARRVPRALGGVTTVLLFLWAGVLGSPLLTGNLANYMQPVNPPESLRSSLAAIATLGAGEGGKAIWLPFSVTGNPLNPAWVPSRVQVPLIDGGVPPVASWEAPSPISSRGVSWLGPAPGRIRDQLIERVLLNDPTAELGSLMTALGCRLIVVRMDVSEGPPLASLIAIHGDVRLAIQDRYFAVFVSTVAQQTVQAFSPTILVAGLDSLALGSAAQPGLGRRSYVLASDIPGGRQDLFMSSASAIWFGPGKVWADLALDTWSGKGRILNVADYVGDTVPLSSWDKDSFDSSRWIPARLAGLSGSLFDPSKAAVFLVADRPATTTLPLTADDAGSEVWARVFVSPLGNSVAAWVSGSQKATSRTFAGTTMGWQWMRLLQLPSQIHSQLQLSVLGQLSAIDQVAIIPSGGVEGAISWLKSLSASADIVSENSGQRLARPVVIAGAAHPSQFQQLNYFENFDPGWLAKGGQTELHYRANGFINGYVGHWQPGAKVAYFFSPDDWIARGRLVSMAVLILTVCGFVLLLTRSRVRPLTAQVPLKRR
jgi:hypothetical protein